MQLFQNNFVGVYLWQALLAACLISFPFSSMLTEPRDCSVSNECSLLQAQNPDNPVPTFPASSAPKEWTCDPVLANEIEGEVYWGLLRKFLLS